MIKCKAQWGALNVLNHLLLSKVNAVRNGYILNPGQKNRRIIRHEGVKNDGVFKDIDIKNVISNVKKLLLDKRLISEGFMSLKSCEHENILIWFLFTLCKQFYSL